MDEKLKVVARYFKEDMIDFIAECWNDLGDAETGMSAEETEAYLGHATDGTSQEEIDNEVSEMQLAYYTEGKATLDEVVDTFTRMLTGGEL